jgi:hypothetical protein
MYPNVPEPPYASSTVEHPRLQTYMPKVLLRRLVTKTECANQKVIMAETRANVLLHGQDSAVHDARMLRAGGISHGLVCRFR